MTDQHYDYQRFAVLYVDDETHSLSLFKQAFEDTFRIFTAASAQEGLKVLEAHGDEIGLIMTDQRMPGEKGVWLLEHARQLRPRILRILATAYTDMDAAIQAVNAGSIYKYITKPWEPMQLEDTLKRGLEFFIVQTERDQLLLEKQSLLRERMIASRVVSLGLVSAGLNHHIGNRLASVNTVLGLMKTGTFDGELLQKALTDANEILGLLNDLRMAASVSPAAELGDDIQLRSLLAELLDKIRPAFTVRKIVIENLVPESLPLFRSDRLRFSRLLELLFKYELGLLPGNSLVRITASEMSFHDKPGLSILLQDNGPAQPADNLQLVMDPLVLQGHPTEYSINLMICFFIVYHHGGSIEVDSPPEGGNRFHIRIPLQPEPSVINRDEVQLFEKVLRNEQLWTRLITGG